METPVASRNFASLCVCCGKVITVAEFDKSAPFESIVVINSTVDIQPDFLLLTTDRKPV